MPVPGKTAVASASGTRAPLRLMTTETTETTEATETTETIETIETIETSATSATSATKSWQKSCCCGEQIADCGLIWPAPRQTAPG